MKQADWSRWAVVGPNDDSGLGQMCMDMKKVLGLGRHLTIPTERFFDRPIEAGLDFVLRRDDSLEKVEELIEGLDGVFFIERWWNDVLLPALKKRGIRIVAVPMWEWLNASDPAWSLVDVFACPNEFGRRILEGLGFRNAVMIPWTLDLSRLPARELTGLSRIFIHNAGYVDSDDRKGTGAVIRAFSRVKNPALQLEVRMQKGPDFEVKDRRISIETGGRSEKAELYATGDVALQPSKMEGLGFMVLEAVCSGLPVVTLDYPPMNEMVDEPALRVRPRWFRRRAFATNWVSQAHLRLPDETDLARKIEYCASHDLSRVSRRNRAWAEKTFMPSSLRDQWRKVME